MTKCNVIELYALHDYTTAVKPLNDDDVIFNSVFFLLWDGMKIRLN